MLHVTVATLVEQKHKFLMVEESPDGFQVYNQPAGHWQPGESIVEAAVRETLEETAWHVEITGLIGIYQIVINGDTYFRYGFAAKAIEHDTNYSIDSDIDAVHWMSDQQVRLCRPQHRSELVQSLIDDYQQNQCHSLALLKRPL